MIVKWIKENEEKMIIDGILLHKKICLKDYILVLVYEVERNSYA